jgi:hypothetical protein
MSPGVADGSARGQSGFAHLAGSVGWLLNSNDTPVPVGTGKASGTIVGDQTREFERQVDAFPLLDSVRRWVAPFDGTIRIAGGVKLADDAGTDEKADGVRVAVQHENSELWAQRIMPDDHAQYTPSGVDGSRCAAASALDGPVKCSVFCRSVSRGLSTLSSTTG